MAASSQAQYQSEVASQSAKYTAEMADRNRKISEFAAKEALAKGEMEAGVIREKEMKTIGAERAAVGALGVTPEGSPLDLMGETARQYERDATNAVFGGQFEAWKARTQGESSWLEGLGTAARYKAEAALYENKSDLALMSIPFGIGSSLITGYGRYQIASKGGNPWAPSYYGGGFGS